MVSRVSASRNGSVTASALTSVSRVMATAFASQKALYTLVASQGLRQGLANADQMHDREQAGFFVVGDFSCARVREQSGDMRLAGEE
jgi:hypothetical protein